MNIRGKKDGFMNILKQLSLIWLRRKLGSTVKLQHFLQGFPDSSVSQINQHFLSSFLCWTLLKKGYFFGILNSLANTSVYFWLIQLSKTSLLGQIFFWQNSLGLWEEQILLKAKAYIYICVSLLALLGISPLANCEVPWFGGSFPWLYSRCHLPLLGKKLIHISGKLDFLFNLLGRAEAAFLLGPQLIGTSSPRNPSSGLRFFGQISFGISELVDSTNFCREGKSPLAFISFWRYYLGLCLKNRLT